MLDSVLPYIDGCICVDTGSSDSSKKVVTDYFKEKNIPCEIYDHPFKDFADARNFALDRAKEKKEGYAFIIDCDETLIVENGFTPKLLKQELFKHDLGTMVVRHGDAQWMRRSFFNLAKSFYWKGKAHQLAECKEPITSVDFNQLSVNVTQDGNSWKEGAVKKYSRQAELLLEEFEKNDSPRDLFYLAQAYRDSSQHEKAIEWYRKRTERKPSSPFNDSFIVYSHDDSPLFPKLEQIKEEAGGDPSNDDETTFDVEKRTHDPRIQMPKKETRFLKELLFRAPFFNVKRSIGLGMF